MSFMDLLASRKAKLGGKYLLPGNDTQPLVGAETAADMGEEEVDMVELREEEMVDKANEEEVREVVDDSKEKDKGKKTLKRSLTSIVKKLKSIESTFRETSRPNHKQERWPLYQSKRQQLAESNPDTQKEIFSG